MEIVDLPAELQPAYFKCFEEWSEEMKESGDHKEKWFRTMQTRGLRVKVARDDRGTGCGMIHYTPIENVAIEGKDLYYMYCIWVHGYKEGAGNRQKQGIGTALLEAAEKDVRELGAKGFVVWGMSLPFFMRASWFKRHGYKRVDRDGIAELLWKPFSPEVVPPKWIKLKKKPSPIPGRVTVTAFTSGWCPAQNITHERARRAAQEFGELVEFHSVNTLERQKAAEWGISEGLFIDSKQLRTGPPPSYDHIKRAISRRLKRLKSKMPLAS